MVVLLPPVVAAAEATAVGLKLYRPTGSASLPLAARLLLLLEGICWYWCCGVLLPSVYADDRDDDGDDDDDGTAVGADTPLPISMAMVP